MSDIPNNPESTSLSRRDVIKVASAFGSAAVFNAACSRLGSLTETPQVTTPTPTEKIIESEIEKPINISIGGRVESEINNPSVEKVSFLISEEVIKGESSLIKEGELMSVNYSLDSVAPIQSLSINSQDLLGIENARVKMEPLTDTYGAVNTLYLTEKLLDVAKGNNQDLTIDEDAKRIIEQIEIRYGPRSSEDSRLMLTMILPNDSFTYSDENGVHQVNPAERFVTGELSIGIKRRGDLSPGVATGPIELKADDFHLYNEKGTLLAEVESIDLSNPKTITIKSGVGQSTQSKSTKRDSAESPKSPSDNKENKWTKQWEPNQTVPLRDWWNEMVSEGHVRINSLAQSYVDDILNGGNLVPNPVEYYKNQYPLIGNCKNLLIDLRTRGKGHVTISEEAFEQIPGGNDCQVFSKNK